MKVKSGKFEGRKLRYDIARIMRHAHELHRIFTALSGHSPLKEFRNCLAKAWSAAKSDMRDYADGCTAGGFGLVYHVEEV